MILNLTPHPVTIRVNGVEETLPREPRPVPRVRTKQVTTLPNGRRAPAMLQGTGFPAVVLKTVIDPPLPAPQPGVWLVVSEKVFDACPERRDVVCPFGVGEEDDSKFCVAFRRRL